MRNSLIFLICSLFWVKPVFAETRFCGVFKQGELITGQAEGLKEISLHHKTFPVAEDGQFLLVMARDESLTTNIDFFDKNGTKTVYTFNVEPTQWDIQHIKGVEQRKVTPAQQDEAEILREQKDVRAALTVVDVQRQDWKKGFIIPVEGVISGHFGNQRIFNNVPKSPHTGTDIAAAEGTPVKASADGKVLLSGGNYFYGGNMVILDHGMGLQTIYMHLKETLVQKGDEVKQGDIIGSVGKTGRATGAHLHWGASLNNIRFRPHALVELPEQPCGTYADLIKDKK